MTSISNIWQQFYSILSNLNNFHSLEVVDRVIKLIKPTVVVIIGAMVKWEFFATYIQLIEVVGCICSIISRKIEMVASCSSRDAAPLHILLITDDW